MPSISVILLFQLLLLPNAQKLVPTYNIKQYQTVNWAGKNIESIQIVDNYLIVTKDESDYWVEIYNITSEKLLAKAVYCNDFSIGRFMYGPVSFDKQSQSLYWLDYSQAKVYKYQMSDIQVNNRVKPEVGLELNDKRKYQNFVYFEYVASGSFVFYSLVDTSRFLVCHDGKIEKRGSIKHLIPDFKQKIKTQSSSSWLLSQSCLSPDKKHVFTLSSNFNKGVVQSFADGSLLYTYAGNPAIKPKSDTELDLLKDIYTYEQVLASGKYYFASYIGKPIHAINSKGQMIRNLPQEIHVFNLNAELIAVIKTSFEFHQMALDPKNNHIYFDNSKRKLIKSNFDFSQL